LISKEEIREFKVRKEKIRTFPWKPPGRSDEPQAVGQWMEFPAIAEQNRPAFPLLEMPFGHQNPGSWVLTFITFI